MGVFAIVSLLMGGASIAIPVFAAPGKKTFSGSSGSSGSSGLGVDSSVPAGMVKFKNQLGTEYLWTEAKYKTWKDIQGYIADILLSERWKSWTGLNSFRRLTNGGKIDAVHNQVDINSDYYKRGWIYGRDFSYLDFYYPGIDHNNLGQGSESAFTIWLNGKDGKSVLTKVLKLIPIVKSVVELFESEN